jgi:hypothetical protein
MKLILPLLLLVTCFTSFAQSDNITRNAVFRSFEEFKNNTPSIHPIDIFIEQTGEDKFVLNYRDATGNTQEYKESLWGFSDSNDVYVKYNKHYAKFMALGKLCVFKYFHESEKIYTDGYKPSKYDPLSKLHPYYETKEKEESYLLDVNTGKITTLKASAVKKLITDDAELSAEYNQLGEYNQDRDKLSFIRKYNERNPR